MTSTPPQKEYLLITKEELKAIVKGKTFWDIVGIVLAVQSRPAPTPQEKLIRSYCKHPNAGIRRSCSGLCRGPGPADDCEYFQHEQSQEQHDNQIRTAIIKEFMDCAFLPGIVHPDSEEGKFLKIIAKKLSASTSTQEHHP